MKFQAVIFDLFGTLVDNFSTTEHKRILSHMASVLGAPDEPFMELWFNTFNMRCIGELKTTAENILYICRNLNVFPASRQLDKAINIRFSYTRDSLAPKEKAVETITSIKNHGYKLALISDCSSEVPVIWNDTPFSGLFDISIFSCEAGIKKPDIEIYKLACEKLAVSPEQCLYVGDGSSNELTGAASAGMVPILFRDENESDAHRIDEQSWKGDKISHINEVLGYLIVGTL